MRLGCLLVSAALLASLVLEPPRAKAFELTSSMVTALAGGFLNACGLAPVVSGMSSSGDVNEALARLIQEYLTAERPGVDIISWLGHVVIQAKSGNKLVIPAAAAGALSAFAQWVASKYATSEDGIVRSGISQVYSGRSITFADGSTYLLASYTYVQSSGGYSIKGYTPGTPIPVGTFSNPFTIQATPTRKILVYEDNGNVVYFGLSSMTYDFSSDIYTGVGYFAIGFSNGALSVVAPLSEKYISDNPNGNVLSSNFSAVLLRADELEGMLSGVDLALDVADSVSIPDDLTDDQSLALDVGAVEGMGIEDILQGILDAILAGELAASAEIVDAAEAPVDPEEPDPPVVPVIPEGLDKLGAALTSRFPFSIPWDVYKGVKLLAAPAKAPYFEVDFMAPIARRVGGWKGSTRIVLDFSEYEIIGQVCRWSSTIGFCLMLAAGTKRLIWTA